MVPDSFPGILRIPPNQDGKPLLNEHYATFGPGGVPAFEYFVKNMLQRVQPKRTKYKNLKGHEPISKCFTASDEAFALMVLDNELHVWDEQIKMKNGTSCKKSALRLKKKYTSSHGGNKRKRCGWTREGRKIYKMLTDEIVAQRKEEWRKQVEKKYQDKFCKEMGLQPNSRAVHFSSNDVDGDSDSEIEFGGEDAFEDYRPTNWRSI